MTIQQIYEREGYLVLSSTRTFHVGEVAEEECDWSPLPVGTKLVVTEEITRERAVAWAQRAYPGYDDFILRGNYYKVIAE